MHVETALRAVLDHVWSSRPKVGLHLGRVGLRPSQSTRCRFRHEVDSPDAVRGQRLQSPTIQLGSELPSLRIVLQQNVYRSGPSGEEGGLTAFVG
jgi:hypothetical protein